MMTMDENSNGLKDNRKWYRSYPKVSLALVILLVAAVAYWVMYLKLRPLREYSGLREQPVPLGTSTGNY